ncbi:MAG: hypothetical protein ACD_57C00370G0003 [uncultured bacterium]|jgi:hypothetical protein|nr:MAG: hypothetical protein ACD_57C00370G0003 [uncultured bacterium]
MDFGEYQLFLKTKTVVATTVKSLLRETTEVSDTRNDNGKKFVQEIEASIASESNAASDGNACAQLEVGD